MIGFNLIERLINISRDINPCRFFCNQDLPNPIFRISGLIATIFQTLRAWVSYVGSSFKDRMIEFLSKKRINQEDSQKPLNFNFLLTNSSDQSKVEISQTIASICNLEERNEFVKTAKLLITEDMEDYSKIAMIQNIHRVPPNERNSIASLLLRLPFKDKKQILSVFNDFSSTPFEEKEGIIRNAIRLIALYPDMEDWRICNTLKNVISAPFHERDSMIDDRRGYGVVMLRLG